MEMTATKATFQKYPAYKDSGVEWLGEIPKLWVLTRLGSYFEERKIKVSDKDYPPLSVTKQGILPQLDSAAKTNDGDNRKLVKKGDFVINSRSDRKGSSGIANEDGSVSLINIVMKPVSIHPTFCNYLLKSNAFVEENYRIGHGIVADLWTTRYDEMKNIKIGVPSPEEQTAIAAFLDDKTAKIDCAIAQKEKMIALLKERKQIIIQNAVTKGLDPNAKMKDSGVEWIGEIPEAWEVKRVKHISNVVLGKMICSQNLGSMELKPYLKSKNIQWLKVDVSSVDEMWFTKQEMEQYRLKKDDLVLSEGGEVGKTCIWNNELPECYIQNSAHKVTLNSDCNPFFYLYLFNHIGKQGGFDSIINRVSIGHLTKDKLLNIEVVKPKLQEQNAIVAHIETQSTKIDKAIALQEQQIEKLKELKSTLIDSAVTGKIKVS